ncbi:hypothetical protein AVO43_10470 [Microbulbifer sp. ZGT114]|nr:hypothetical protein AVO43_10470 [Microbulbifer sp. ZGT114]
MGQGIFIVFREKLEEQKFLLERQHIRRDWHQLTQREIQARSETITNGILDRNIELFTDFWETCLDLGRIPANSECELSPQIRRIAGSHNKAHQALVRHFGAKLFKDAEKKRRDDLIVYFALGLFDKRKPQTKMPESLRRDIRFLFRTYSNAITQARNAPFSVADPKLIEEAGRSTFEDLQHGEFIQGHSWIIHKDLLDKLPPILRIYIGCACQLFGELKNIHLIKIHFTSRKVSLLRYDKFEKKAPLLEERIKIKVREQEIDFFTYGDLFEKPPLENKINFYQQQ